MGDRGSDAVVGLAGETFSQERRGPGIERVPEGSGCGQTLIGQGVLELPEQAADEPRRRMQRGDGPDEQGHRTAGGLSLVGVFGEAAGELDVGAGLEILESLDGQAAEEGLEDGLAELGVAEVACGERAVEPGRLHQLVEVRAARVADHLEGRFGVAFAHEVDRPKRADPRRGVAEIVGAKQRGIRALGGVGDLGDEPGASGPVRRPVTDGHAAEEPNDRGARTIGEVADEGAARDVAPHGEQERSDGVEVLWCL